MVFDSESRLWRELTPRRIIFYVLFHGFHIGLFALGWYVVSSISAASSRLVSRARAYELTSSSSSSSRNRWKQESDPRLAGLNTLQYSVWLSRGAGLVLSVDILMILLPMCRNILRVVRPKLRFLPLDESQWFHRQVAYALLIYTIVHVCAHYVK